MRRRTRSEQVEGRLRDADPIRSSSLDAEDLEATLDEIGAAITSQPRRKTRHEPARRLNKRRAALLLAAAALVIGAGVATGALLSAHTGTFPTKAEVAMGGPGEALNPAAPDFQEVALEVASDIPYPAGYESWRDFLISDEINTDAGEGLVSTGALHGWFAASAFCAWVRTWREADLAGDAGAAGRAAQVISEAIAWKAVTDEDPHPDPSVPGDGGFMQYTLFGWMVPYRDAVLAGDRARVDQLLTTGYGDKCWTSDPDWRGQLAEHRDWRGFSKDELGKKYEQFLASRGS
jgi:hypothetical protein